MMRSNKPYLIRAFYEWIADNKCTPFLVANANYPKCKVPLEFVEEGQITLNVSLDAIRDLKIGNEFVEFRASFSGIVHIISVPIKAVLAVYAQENGQGMFFDFEEGENQASDKNEAAWSGRETQNSQTKIKQPDVNQARQVHSETKKTRQSHLKLVE